MRPLPDASWQRCRTHHLRHLLAKVPKSSQSWVATSVRTVFDQPDIASVEAHFACVLDMIGEKSGDAAEHLADAGGDLLAFTAFPRELWRLICRARRPGKATHARDAGIPTRPA